MKYYKRKIGSKFACKYQTLLLPFGFFLILLSAGCSGIYEMSAITETEGTEYIEQSEVIKNNSPFPYSQRMDVDAQTKGKLQSECEEIALLCNDLIVNGEKETLQSFPYDTILTQTAIDEVESLLSEFGYAVINSDSVYPEYLENSNGLKRFYELANEGEKSEQSLALVSENRTIYYFTFRYDGEKMYHIITSIIWDENGEYNISAPAMNQLIDWGMTYNECFYYQIYPLDLHWSACSFIRLQSADKDLYDLYAKYLSPVGYPSSVFTKNWDRQSYKEICFNDLFEPLYTAVYGDYVYSDDYERCTDMSCRLIPANIFEDTILRYFDISLEEFRALSLYTSDSNSYPWQECNPYNVIYCPKLTPEVREKRDNEDGTITLVVDVLCFDYKCFPRFTHEITINPINEVSFQYIENHITYTDEHGVPDTTPRLAAQRNK
ncbi:MAG: DUF6070 family protein [Ruminococcus sp.]|nr:DUF6070 family protein [Ruminococcus sp.]